MYQNCALERTVKTCEGLKGESLQAVRKLLKEPRKVSRVGIIGDMRGRWYSRFVHCTELRARSCAGLPVRDTE